MNTVLFIETDHMNFTKKVWVREKSSTQQHNIHIERSTGLLVRQTFQRGCTIPDDQAKLIPFLEMPIDHFDEIMGLLVTELARNGIKPEVESIMAGKLKGMEDHKNDLKEIINQLIPKIK